MASPSVAEIREKLQKMGRATSGLSSVFRDASTRTEEVRREAKMTGYQQFEASRQAIDERTPTKTGAQSRILIKPASPISRRQDDEKYDPDEKAPAMEPLEQSVPLEQSEQSEQSTMISVPPEIGVMPGVIGGGMFSRSSSPVPTREAWLVRVPRWIPGRVPRASSQQIPDRKLSYDFMNVAWDQEVFTRYDRMSTNRRKIDMRRSIYGSYDQLSTNIRKLDIRRSIYRPPIDLIEGGTVI